MECDRMLSAVSRVALLLSISLPGFVSIAQGVDAPSVVPNPASMQLGKGAFVIEADDAIQVCTDDAALRHAAEYLSDLIWRTQGLRLPIRCDRGSAKRIELRRALRRGAPESYRIDVSAKRIRMIAHSDAGLLHATRTLWQLIQPSAGVGTWSVPISRIKDAPRFAWRGLMLDSARHYQSPEFIRNYIDWMALHKLNVLHWHLTDDQGWRLQILKYPKLTDVGAWRVPAGSAAREEIDPLTEAPRRYGGFYTQQQVREIVAHAAIRSVRIVPEIEMPGHATAALIAYPQFAAGIALPKAVPADWGIYTHAYNVDEATFEFLEDVLDEVMTLFPSEWIHVGGDEVDSSEWQHSPTVQQRMRELGITEPKALQHYFTQRIGRYLQAHGRRLVGWDEILEPGLAENAIVMSWRGIEGALAATAKGHDSVLSPWPKLYFDNRQGIGSDEPPGRVRVISLEDVYRFDPLPAELNADQKRHLLGLQGNVWTEHIRTEERVGWMSFPRAAAIAELGWSSPERRNWNDFQRRVPALLARYDTLKIPYADSAFAVRIAPDFQHASASAKVSLSKQLDVGAIRYTLNGTEVASDSPRYSAPFTVPLPTVVRAASFAGAQKLSRTSLRTLDSAQARYRSSAELKLCSESIALALEDDAPLQGARAVFHLDIQNPCWIFEQADLDTVDRIVAAVGDVPFNFQIGDAVNDIKLVEAETESGELLVFLDRCAGVPITRIPLAATANRHAVSVLPAAPIAAQHGRHDLCFKFAQAGIDPMRTLDWVQLVRVGAEDNKR
jgi:hexosaminidase